MKRNRKARGKVTDREDFLYRIKASEMRSAYYRQPKVKISLPPLRCLQDKERRLEDEKRGSNS